MPGDKIGLIACFSIGAADIIAAVFRLKYVIEVDMTENLTKTMPTSVFLSAFEPLLAIIVACMPMLRPLYVRFKSSRSGADAENSGASSQGKKSLGSGSRTRGGSKSTEMDVIALVQKDEGDMKRESVPGIAVYRVPSADSGCAGTSSPASQQKQWIKIPDDGVQTQPL